MKPNKYRSAIISLFKEGKYQVSIVKNLKLPKSTVSRVIKRYQELGNDKNRSGRGRPVTVTNPNNRAIIRKRIKRNLERSNRAIAKSMGISKFLVQKIVKTQLGLRSRKLSKGQYLTDVMKAKRLEKSKKMLSRIKNQNHWAVVFTDEKVFTVERQHNHQNDRQLLPKRADKNQFLKLYLIKKTFRTQNYFPKPFSRFCDGVGRNNVRWKDSFNFC